MSDFTPSSVVINEPVPFPSTFGRVELETAAAWLIVGMAHRDDTWDAITPQDIAAGLRARHEANPRDNLCLNQFLRPDMDDLVARGFAEYVGEGLDTQLVRFTELGLERLRPWAREGTR